MQNPPLKTMYKRQTAIMMVSRKEKEKGRLINNDVTIKRRSHGWVRRCSASVAMIFVDFFFMGDVQVTFISSPFQDRRRLLDSLVLHRLLSEGRAAIAVPL